MTWKNEWHWDENSLYSRSSIKDKKYSVCCLNYLNIESLGLQVKYFLKWLYNYM